MSFRELNGKTVCFIISYTQLNDLCVREGEGEMICVFFIDRLKLSLQKHVRRKRHRL